MFAKGSKIVYYIIWSLIIFFPNLLFSQQKNVLFIFVDDLNTQINCYGNKFVFSPNIDKLAEKGAIFKRAYCQWSVCGPSRASILSGQIPAQTGIQNLKTQIRDVNPNIVTLPQYFKNKGFTTTAVGKVFDPRNVDDGHDTQSWSIPYSNKYTYPAEYGDFVKGQYRVAENMSTEMGPENVGDDGYMDGQICLSAISKLENFADQPDQPFFLAVGFKKPHVPFIAPKKYWDLYTRDSLQLALFQKMAQGSPDYAYFHAEPAQYEDIPDLWTYNDISLGDRILEPSLQRKLIHGYYACVSYIDAQVGILMEKLEELKLDKNTIIVLLGDHGYHLGDHNQWGKHTNFESAVNAPLIIYSPQHGSINCKTPVDFIDVYPTLTKLVFNEIPQHVSGNDLTPLLVGADISKKYSVSEYRSSGHSSYSFRNNRFRMTLWFAKSTHRPDLSTWNSNNILQGELYDFVEDSLQTINQYDNLEYQKIKDELLKEAEIWWNKQYNQINNITTGINVKKTQIGSFVNNHLKIPESIGIVNVKVYDFMGKLILKKEKQLGNVYFGNVKPGSYVVHLINKESNEISVIRMLRN